MYGYNYKRISNNGFILRVEDCEAEGSYYFDTFDKMMAYIDSLKNDFVGIKGDKNIIV